MNYFISPERERRGVFSPADLLYYIRNRLFKPYLPMAVMDPVWFREETKKKSRRLVLRCLRLFPFYNDYTIRFLVRSQIFVRERLVALGPDLAAAHFLCFKYSTYTLQVFHIYSNPCHILLQVRCLKSFTPAHDLKLLSVNILALSAFGPLAHHLELRFLF